MSRVIVALVGVAILAIAGYLVASGLREPEIDLEPKARIDSGEDAAPREMPPKLETRSLPPEPEVEPEDPEPAVTRAEKRTPVVDERRQARDELERTRELTGSADFSAKIQGWLKRHMESQQQIRKISSLVRDGDVSAAEEFNEQVDIRSNELVVEFGEDFAAQYAKRIKIYKIDLQSGAKIRVDHLGNYVPPEGPREKMRRRR